MSDTRLICPAPAKINLFLHVTGRRPDGYHTLETAFRMLDYGDEIELSLRRDGQVRRTTDVPGVPHDSDLMVRAARLLQQRTGCASGVDIAIEKRLPMGGGLGGGSSDAASVLLGLNRLWNLQVPRATLQEWALALGADVPFFIFGRSALAGGIGEALIPIRLPETWYVVIEPPASVPTAEIFSAEGLTRNTEAIIISGFAARPISVAELLRIIEAGRNDLQPVACQRYPVVNDAVNALSKYGKARMTGSGACVFLPCASEVAAQSIVDSVSRDWQVWKARGVDEHPLSSFAA